LIASVAISGADAPVALASMNTTVTVGLKTSKLVVKLPAP